MTDFLNNASPIVIDLIVVGIVVLIGLIYAKKGLYQIAMTPLVLILSIVVGLMVSKIALEPVTEKVWENYGPTVEEAFDNKVEDALEGKSSFVDGIKHSWNTLIKSFNNENLDSLTIEDYEDMDYTDSVLVQKVKVFTMLKAKLILKNLVHVVLFGVISAVALLILTLVKNKVGKLADLPVISWVNKGGGFVVGALIVLVIIILVTRFLGFIGIPFFTNLADGTIILNWLVNGNLQSAIGFVQGLTMEDIKSLDIQSILNNYNLSDVTENLSEAISNIDLDELFNEIEEIA